MLQSKLQSYPMKITARHNEAGVFHHDVVVPDIFARKRFVVERALVRAFTNSLELYLRRHPTMQFDHPRNLARILTYVPRGMRAWSQYMPGGFATYFTSEPQHRKLHDGKKIDRITRGFFRHTYDAVGLRSRSAVLAALAIRYIEDKSNEPMIHWVSIAAGAGQHVVPFLQGLPRSVRSKLSWTFVDIDPDIRQFAEGVYSVSGVQVARAEFISGDIFESGIQQTLDQIHPHVIDAMGLFDYLSDDQARQLITLLYQCLRSGSMLVFSNMNDTRPHLNVHQRAVGWPGVIPRSRVQMVQLITAAGVADGCVSTYQPQDRVYTVYRVEKP